MTNLGKRNGDWLVLYSARARPPLFAHFASNERQTRRDGSSTRSGCALFAHFASNERQTGSAQRAKTRGLLRSRPAERSSARSDRQRLPRVQCQICFSENTSTRSGDHVLGVIERDLSASAEPAKRVDNDALGVQNRLEGDGTVFVDLGFELAGRSRREFRQQLPTNSGLGPEEGVEHLVRGNLVENRSEVDSVEQFEVFKLNEVRQGFPPDRLGREG